MNQEIPLPITFNPHKHHLGFLMERIHQWKKEEWEMVEEELRTIGTNLLDLYLGSLSVSSVCKACLLFFANHNITNADQFHDWLSTAKYKKITLPDTSRWVIKKGTDTRRYIHIHPAKNSVHTIRVRATTLKTVVALKIFEKSRGKNASTNLHTVNQIRKEYLNLSPVKSLTHGKGIARLWDLFDDSRK